MNQPTERNEYELFSFRGGSPAQKIVFYQMNPDGSYKNGTTLEEMLRVCSERFADLDSRFHKGTTLEEMLRVCSERLADLDSHFHCQENEDALKHIEEARILLDTRTKDRIARGVEGKHEV